MIFIFILGRMFPNENFLMKKLLKDCQKRNFLDLS